MGGFMDTRWEIDFSGKPAPSPPVPVEISLDKYDEMLENGEILKQPRDCSTHFKMEKCVFSSAFPVFDALDDLKANCLKGMKDTRMIQRITDWPILNGKPFRYSISYESASSPGECILPVDKMIFTDSDASVNAFLAPPNFQLLFMKAYSAVARALVNQG
jgi:hypothetical protein